ncbi:MAG: HEAT repeat domain-containing protein, partial [Calditrichaeota bacterium]|nr:HEAT repeat domain-containing protein [Calditrichota bacterium]
QYLTKLVEEKKKQRRLTKALFFTGHGYHSESLSAWESEALALREQFPQLYFPGKRLFNYNHSMSPDLKATILRVLAREPINLTVFHAHGAVDTQYLLGNPPAETIGAQTEAIKLFLRSKLRSAKARKKSVAETKLNYMERFNIPLDWFDGAFDDSVMRADSLKAAKMDIYSKDVRKISPRSNMIVFDECFNGAFFKNSYLAGEYLFNKGEMLVAIANSVNVLQDIWADEFLGLIGMGARVGLVHRMNPYLESQILGDPTFQFYGEQNNQINSLLQACGSVSDWEKLLRSPDVPLRSLAVFKLSQKKDQKYLDKFLEIYHHDESFVVRAEALRAVAQTRSVQLRNLLLQSIHDPFEFIRRKSVVLMGDIGRKKFVSPLIVAALSDPSERVVFSAKTALSKILILKEDVEKYTKKFSDRFSEDEISKLLKTTSILRSRDVRKEYLPKIKNEKLPLRKRISAARFFRNYRFHEAVPELIAVAQEKALDTNLRKAIIEALGWFVYSYQREKIINFCKEIISDKNEQDAIKSEARKTRTRLLVGANHSLTP